MRPRPPVVLVHGAWQTAATWDLVAPALRDRGHDVFTVALTGLEGVAGELTPDITLDTHIDDVLRVLESRNLRDATLVGHSYAGMIVTGVANRAESRIARLVYVDGFIPEDGQSAMQLMPPPVQSMFRDQAAASGDGWLLKSSDRLLDLWGLQPGPARDFVNTRLCDFSINCFEQPVSMPHVRTSTIPRTYIACVGEAYAARPVFERFAAHARSAGWDHHELPTGHACHVEMPDAFIDLLVSAC